MNERAIMYSFCGVCSPVDGASPNMFVSKLAACCTILFLTRSDPERLKELSHRWALRFAMDRRRLLHSIAKRWRIEPPLDLASSSSTESEGGTTVSAESTGATAESEKPSTTQKRVSGDGHITTPLSSTLYTSVELPLCSEDASVGHFFNVLNSLVPSYFSFNWHRMDYIIQINREYESFVRESLMPICLGINPLEGEDDPDTRLWLIPPSEYMNPPASLPRTLSTSSCTNNNTNGELSLHPWRPTLLPASNNNKSMLMESEEQRSSNNVSPTSSSSVRGLPGFMNTPVSGGPSANFPRSTTAMMMMMRRATSDMVISPNMSSPTSTDFSSFDFLTVTNFRAALFHNQRGLVLLFHAKYSPKSSIVCNILKEIIARKRLDPMPTVAVIYAVAEPELAGLYNIRWMPTIVFVPPCSSERVMEETSENSQGSSTHDLPQPNGQTAQPSQTWSGEGGGEELEMAATHCPMLCAAEHDTSTRCTSTSNNNISASASTSITTVAARATTSSFSDANHFSTTRYGYTHVLPFHTGATSSTSAPNNNNNNSTSTNNLCTSPRTAEVAAVVAHSPTARLYGFSAEHIHSLSQSSMRMATPLASSSLASSSEELRTLIAKDEHCVYPNAAPSTVEAIESWIASKGLVEPPVRSAKELLTDIHSIREGQKFQQARELRSAVVTLRRLQEDEGSNSSCGASSPNTMGAGRDLNAITSNSTPPMFVFLGGGMAAGKSTATAGLATSAWWQPCKQGSVLVNADEFKLITPNNTSEVPSWMQHDNSTRAAETMLINAVNQGRSVVFDGTMMWAPFVVQVIEMVRRAHTTLHARGRGYCGPGREEVYFVPQRPRMKPLPHPYKIVLLGITVDVETAVPRGFLRTFSTGRGVPIGVQIRSFKLFAENFERYASLVDAVTLYNNNVFVDLNRGELPPVIVERSDATGGEFVVHDHDAFQSFQRQRLLREDADNVFELYPPTSPSQQAEPTSTLVGAATTT